MAPRLPDGTGMSLNSRLRALRWQRLTMGLVAMLLLVIVVTFAAALGGILAAVAIDAARVNAAAKLESTSPVCDDPNNLPFSNVSKQRFEYAVARVAWNMGRPLPYDHRPAPRGFPSRTLLANECDVVTALPTSLERVTVTRP